MTKERDIYDDEADLARKGKLLPAYNERGRRRPDLTQLVVGKNSSAFISSQRPPARYVLCKRKEGDHSLLYLTIAVGPQAALDAEKAVALLHEELKTMEGDLVSFPLSLNTRQVGMTSCGALDVRQS